MKINEHCHRHVQTWHESGLSQADYCRQQGINPKTFSRWSRLELAMDKDAPLEVIPIQIARSATAAEASMMLHLAQGAQLELSTAVSPRWLAELLQCLA